MGRFENQRNCDADCQKEKITEKLDEDIKRLLKANHESIASEAIIDNILNKLNPEEREGFNLYLAELEEVHSQSEDNLKQLKDLYKKSKQGDNGQLREEFLPQPNTKEINNIIPFTVIAQGEIEVFNSKYNIVGVDIQKVENNLYKVIIVGERKRGILTRRTDNTILVQYDGGNSIRVSDEYGNKLSGVIPIQNERVIERGYNQRNHNGRIYGKMTQTQSPYVNLSLEGGKIKLQLRFNK